MNEGTNVYDSAGSTETPARVDLSGRRSSEGKGDQPSRRQSRRNSRRPSRRVWRWVANLLIIGGVLLLAYPLGTWGYTWYEQRQLGNQLNKENPQLAVAAAAALGSPDLIQVTPGATTPSSTTTTVPAASGQVTETTVTTLSPVEAERQAQLAAFRQAADDFERSLGNNTGKPLGRLLIPSIKLDKVLIEGVGDGDLRQGPGHWPETPFPGQGNNFVISGHRTTYGAPFLKLNKVKVGDEIDVVLPYAIVRYTVTRTVIVSPKDMASVAQLGHEQISLAACHPIASARQRILVQGDMVGFKLIGK
jgi:sortase A